MKKIFLLTIVFIAAHNILSAQFSFGIHTGVDINNVAISGVPNVLTNPKTVIVQPRYGVHGILDFNEQSSVKAELNYIKGDLALTRILQTLALIYLSVYRQV